MEKQNEAIIMRMKVTMFKARSHFFATTRTAVRIETILKPEDHVACRLILMFALLKKC